MKRTTLGLALAFLLFSTCDVSAQTVTQLLSEIEALSAQTAAEIAKKVATIRALLEPVPDPCTFTVSPATATAPATNPVPGTITVTASSQNCPWTTSSNSTWLTVGPGGTGTGTVGYTVASNTGPTRTGTLTIGGQGFILTQETGVVQPPTGLPANYSLEIIAPRANLPAGHRMLRAYPDLPYRVRVSAVFGRYPYRYRLLNAPAGMTIVEGPCSDIGVACLAGSIDWPSPAGIATPAVEVCDLAGLGTCVRQTWTITTNRTGFMFIDAVNGNDSWSGTAPVREPGTTIGPKRTLASTKAVDNGLTIWYFLNGTYTLAGLTLEGGNPLVEFDYSGDAGTGNSTQWIAYPGHSPVFDIRYPTISQAPFARFISPYAYVEGFTCTRDWVKCWEWAPANSNSHGTFWKNNFINGGPGQDGLNAGYIMTSSNSYQYQGYLSIQNNTFGAGGHNAVKLYSIKNLLYEDNDNLRGSEGLAVKAAVSRFTIRTSKWLGCNIGCITGNWNISNGLGTYGEVYRNFSTGSGSGFIYAAESLVGHPIGPLFAYHNTIVDTIRIDRVSSADNLLTFRNNVIINSTAQSGSCPAKFTFVSSDCSRVVSIDNLLGTVSNNIVDSQGRLLEPYRSQWLGQRGYEY